MIRPATGKPLAICIEQGGDSPGIETGSCATSDAASCPGFQPPNAPAVMTADTCHEAGTCPN